MKKIAPSIAQCAGIDGAMPSGQDARRYETGLGTGAKALGA